MKFRYWRLKLTLTIIAFVLLCVYFIYQYVGKHQSCSNSEMKRGINELCALYKAGTVAGDLCDPLCTDYAIRPVTCLGHRDGKRVLTAMWGEIEVIIKSTSLNLTTHRREWLTEYDASSLHLYRASVLDVMRGMHGIAVPEQREVSILDQMWSHRFNWREGGEVEVKSAMLSLWSLVNQVEYARMRYYQGYPHVPMLRGTCGYVYAVASVPTSTVFDLNPLSSHVHLWSDRVRIASAFLDLVTDMDTQFPEPMSICDIQPGNFGLLTDAVDPRTASVQPVVFLIDMDLVLPATYTKVTPAEDCLTDDSCNFFDCKGRCKAGKCVSEWINNNLQGICANIFVGRWSLGFPGLLSNPPESIKHKLENVLELCVNPHVPDGSLRAPKDIVNEIHDLLKNSYTV